jgi:hypothetical protein
LWSRAEKTGAEQSQTSLNVRPLSPTRYIAHETERRGKLFLYVSYGQTISLGRSQ